MWSRRSALLKELLPPSSWQDMILHKPHKWCSLQDRILAHDMAEDEINMQDFLLYIIL
jgi:hypothetical protein